MVSIERDAPIAAQPDNLGSADNEAVLRRPLEPTISLRRHPFIAAATALVVLLSGALAIHRGFKPTYSVESVVYVSPTFPKELVDDREQDRQYDSFVEQQVAAIAQYETLREALASEPGVWRLPGESEQSAIQRLQKSLKITEVGHSYLVSITLQSENRVDLAKFVNTLTLVYLRKARQDEFYGRDQRVATLGAEEARLQELLQTKLNEQNDLLRDLGMAHLDGKVGTNPFDSELAKLHDELTDAHEKRTEANARLLLLNSSEASTKLSTLDEAAEAEINSDPSLATVKVQLNTRRAVLLTQLNGLTPHNPLYVQSKSELQSIDGELADFTAQFRRKKANEIQQRYAGERNRAIAMEAQLQSDVRRTTSLATAAGPKLQRAEALSSEIERLQGAYWSLESRIDSLTLEGASPGSVHLDTPAITPERPDPQKKGLFVGLLCVAGLLAGPVAAVLANMADPRLYTASDVRTIMGFPPIATLLASGDSDPQVENEQYVRLTGGIDTALRRTGAHSFIFTPVGAGCTNDLVARLGRELADSGLRTLTIFMSEQTRLAPGEHVHRSAVPLQGAAVPGPTQLYSQGADGRDNVFPSSDQTECFKAIVLTPQVICKHLRDESSSYDVLLVAGHPILSSAHSENIARMTDCAVLTVTAGTTTREQLKSAATLFQRIRVPGIAVVLRNMT